MHFADLLGMFQQGWLTPYPLLLASVIVLGVFLERLWRFRGLHDKTRALTKSTIDALVKRDLDRARKLCEDSNQPIAQIFLEAMRWRNVPLEDLERVLATSRHEAAYELKRGLWIIGTIGSLAPFIGLFGTVVGIMIAFQEISKNTGAATLDTVGPHIAEALFATAIGLVAAVPAVMAYNYFTRRFRVLRSEMETFEQDYLNIIKRHFLR